MPTTVPRPASSREPSAGGCGRDADTAALWTRNGTEWSGERVDRASEEDFAAYVGLRWQPLVRTLVLLGCPPDRAEQVTRTALSRVHRSWARIRRSDDVDVQVFRRLLRTWPATRRRHTRRTALVLHSVGGLSVVQVRAVLGRGTPFSCLRRRRGSTCAR